MHRIVALSFGVAFATWGLPGSAQESPYRSPYRVEFSFPKSDLVGDLESTERGSPRLQAEVPFREWYSRRVLERWGSWGPPAAFYPPIPEIESWPVERRRERVLAVALRYQGYAYQHHHIPDWDPPAHWHWKPTCAGHNGKGVDCSDFTGFVYNLGFGLRFSTDVHLQAEQRAVRMNDGREARLHLVELPSAYEERLATLRTGDLVFIKNKEGKISHVVFWVGPIGQSPDGVPLVLDSHGADARDSEDHTIPCGIHLRPFRKASWYNESASHALRVFRD